MNATGVVAALTAEARTLDSAIRRRDRLTRIEDGTLVAVSGIGCAAAALAARALVDAGAASLVSWGMAGALDPSLRAGAICLPDEVISGDGESFVTAHHWRECLSAAVGAQRPVVGGRLLTSTHAIDTVAGKACAFRDTGAAAVDMESLAVAQIAATHALPFIAVRVIVDSAADVLPESVVAASRAGQVQFGRLIAGLVRSPVDIAALIRLAQRHRSATRSLAAVARSGALSSGALAEAHGSRIA